MGALKVLKTKGFPVCEDRSFIMQKCVKYYVNIKKNVVEGVICFFFSFMFLLLLN